MLQVLEHFFFSSGKKVLSFIRDGQVTFLIPLFIFFLYPTPVVPAPSLRWLPDAGDTRKNTILLTTQQERSGCSPYDTYSWLSWHYIPLVFFLAILSFRRGLTPVLTSQCWRASGCSPKHLPFLPVYLGDIIWFHGFQWYLNTGDSQICFYSHDFSAGFQTLISKYLFSIITRMSNCCLKVAQNQTLISPP